VGQYPHHTEDAIGHDHDLLRTSRFLQNSPQIAHIFVAKDFARRFAEADTIDNAGMIEFIADNQVILLHQRGDHTEIGGVTRLHSQRGLGVFKTRQLLFQFFVQGHRASNGPHSAGANAIALNRRAGGLAQTRMDGQAKIVIKESVMTSRPSMMTVAFCASPAHVDARKRRVSLNHQARGSEMSLISP